ncbi:response regulator transcription factor [Herbaspirillum sp. HC18]|nr:response regulator transcription factor [Herbaspirillum sp. HC18]
MKEFVIVDDHPLVLAALKTILSSAFSETHIRCISSTGELKAFLSESRATEEARQTLMAFVDLNLPDADGIDVIRRIRAHFDIPVIAMSGSHEPEKIRRCAQSGAAGFIEKSSNVGIYPAVASLVLSGGTFFPSELARTDACNATTGNPPVALTARQKEVLELLVDGKPNKIIAATLGLSEGTVKNHVGALLERFKVKSRSQLILATIRCNSIAGR